MPELPDLQVFSKNLFSKIGNKEIQQVNIYNTKKVKKYLVFHEVVRNCTFIQIMTMFLVFI